MPATFEPIATTLLTSATNTITFSSIPATYTDLYIVFSSLSDTNNTQRIRFNGDTAANYWLRYFYGTYAGSVDGSTTNADSIYTISAITGASTTKPGTAVVHVLNYRRTDRLKTVLQTFGQAATSSVGDATFLVATWNNTNAINSISFTRTGGNYNAGTTATIYGITAA